MRTLSLITKVSITAVVAAVMVGCTTANQGPATVMGPTTGEDRNVQSPPIYPASQLGFTPVTYASELTKWSSYIGRDHLRFYSMESYRMSVPVAAPDVNLAGLPLFSEDLPPGSVFVEAAAGEPPQAKRVIRHVPHQR